MKKIDKKNKTLLEIRNTCTNTWKNYSKTGTVEDKVWRITKTVNFVRFTFLRAAITTKSTSIK